MIQCIQHQWSFSHVRAAHIAGGPLFSSASKGRSQRLLIWTGLKVPRIADTFTRWPGFGDEVERYLQLDTQQYRPPYIYVKGTSLGSLDRVVDLLESGKLIVLLFP